jgi:hypothetical protein
VDADGNGGDGFAEHQNDEQPEPFWEVLEMQWQAGRAHGCHDRRGRLGRDRGRPAEVAGRGRRDRPGKPQRPGKALGDRIHRDEGAGLDHMAIGTQVEIDQHDPEGGLAERELRRQALRCVAGAGGQAGDGQHGRELGQPVDDVVGIEAVGVEGEAGPRPPHAGEQSSKHQSTVEGQVVTQSDRELGDDQDEGEIKEQLEPGRRALLARVGLAVLQPGRPDQIRPRHHRRPSPDPWAVAPNDPEGAAAEGGGKAAEAALAALGPVLVMLAL